MSEVPVGAIVPSINHVENGFSNNDRVLLRNLSKEQVSDWLFNIENTSNGSHFMSPDDNREYQRLHNTKMVDGIVFLRDKWSEYADHEFFKKFVLIHWVGQDEMGLDRMSKLLGNGRHQVEISTQAYSDSESLIKNRRWLKSKFGVLVSGQVTLASNEDIQTNQWHMLQPSDTIFRRKYTEYANRLMTDETNCISPYEFVVGDWVASGILVDPDSDQRDKIDLLAKQHGLSVMTTTDEDLFRSKK
ncbi:MAG: hypothetical protein KIH89_000780 [Candidatus Shapirobacteria bacterium]|nr:hypothetical protein [Candidatus Shapirobacteria bacterium]